MPESSSFTQDMVSSMVRGQSPWTVTFLDILLLLALLIGAFKLLVLIWNLLAGSWKHCCRGRCQRRDRLFQKYGLTIEGHRSWIVVTGGSDGIGLEVAKRAARDSGFNVCIVSRNEQKIKEKLKEFPDDIETMCVVADFTKMSSIQEYQEMIGDKLKHIDIGLLILNAGWAEFGPFEWISNKLVEDHIRINLLHVIYTAKVLASQMVRRYEQYRKKSGIVIVSSGLGLQPLGGCIPYSASKTFVSYFGQGLAVEMSGKIDVMVYHAGVVNTKFIDDMDEKMKRNKMMVIQVGTAGEVCLRDLGCDVTTGGALKHCITFLIRPDRLFAKIMFKVGKEQYQKMHPDDPRFQ